MSPGLEQLDYIGSWRFGQALSVILGLGLAGVVPFAVLAARLVASRRLRATDAESARTFDGSTKPLAAGAGCEVKGVVEPDSTASPVAEVEIVQEANDHTLRNSKWHTWEERQRDVRVRPFYLRCDDGQVVLVEPSRDVLVIDDLELVATPHLPRRRIQRCVVDAGETVVVYGDLHRAHHPRAQGTYRDAGEGFVLRAPDAGRMVLATDAIKVRHSERAASLHTWFRFCGALWLAFAMFVLAPFALAITVGRHENARLDWESNVVIGGNVLSQNHHVETVTTAERKIAGDVPPETFEAIRKAHFWAEGPVSVPVILNPPPFGGYLGREPSLGVAPVIGSLFAWAFLFFALWAHHRTKYAWYDREKLSEEGGPGHYEEVRTG